MARALCSAYWYDAECGLGGLLKDKTRFSTTSFIQLGCIHVHPTNFRVCMSRNTIATNDFIAAYSASPKPITQLIHLCLCCLCRLLWVNLLSILVEADSWRWSSVPATFSRTNTMKPMSDILNLHLWRRAQ